MSRRIYNWGLRWDRRERRFGRFWRSCVPSAPVGPAVPLLVREAAMCK